MPIPAEYQTFVSAFIGVVLGAIGLSFGYKFVQASVYGRVNYWAGLEHFGWYFIPITTLITPLLCHMPAKDSSLIKTKTALYVHLLFGPVFFLLSLMFLVAGADYMGLPGTKAMNYVLTFGRPDVPAAITYRPPFTYKFPILRKARKVVFKFLTQDIQTDKSKSLNAWERSGKNVDSFSGGDWGEEDEEAEEAREQEEEARRREAERQAQSSRNGR